MAGTASAVKPVDASLAVREGPRRAKLPGRAEGRRGKLRGRGEDRAKLLARTLRSQGQRWLDEALGMPAALLPVLPSPPSVGLSVPGVSDVVRVVMDARRLETPRAEGELVFDADEWRALVLGAEADRIWPADLAAFCARKRSDPAWRVDTEVALAGAQPDVAETWSAARVLERLGAQVLGVELESG